MKIDLLSAITTMYSTTTTLGEGNEDLASTSIALSTTSSLVDLPTINIEIAQNYMDSLTNEQLVELIDELENTEIEITKNTVLDMNEEKPVVKFKS